MSCMNGSWILVWMQCTIDVLQPSSSPGFQHPMSLWGLMESFGLQVGGVGIQNDEFSKCWQV